MYWKPPGGECVGIVLTLVPFSLRSSTLLFVIQIIPEGERKKKKGIKKKLQIDVKIPERLHLAGSELEGKRSPSQQQRGKPSLSVHRLASFSALFLELSRSDCQSAAVSVTKWKTRG